MRIIAKKVALNRSFYLRKERDILDEEIIR